MIGSFAGVVFQTSDRRVQNFHDLKRDTEVRYANHEVIGTKPKSEFLGAGLDKLSFSMELNAFFGVSPMSVINKLRAYAQKGRSGYFVLGGRSMGKFKILSLSEGYGIITNSGGVVSVKLDVALEEYK